MRNELITFRNSVLAGMLCLVAASCSDDGDTDNRLPDGKYPMTFTASVDGLAVSRATSEGSWIGDGTEKVAIQIGQDVKKYTAASGGSLTVDENEDGPFCWTSKAMQVSAWYPYSETQPKTFSIKEDQKDNGYQESDFLYAMEKITFETGNSSANLVFKHLPAKVIVNLKNGDGVREDEVSGATVSFVNQATVSGEITWNEDAGTVSVEQIKSVDLSGAITPNEIDPASSYQKSVQALLAPKQMQNQQFIKVTLDGFDYFYTPTKEDDADLAAGKLYTYNITVKKEGLSVTTEKPVSWNEEKLEIKDTPTKATLRVYLPEDLELNNLTIEGATSKDNSHVYEISDNANTFSISYTITDENKAKGFLITNGLGECTRTDDGGTYTFTYSNIRSDLRLSYTLYSEVGYYYYSDGTCSSKYEEGDNPTCIGIVFKLGAGKGDDVSNYTADTFEDDMIHGYVVALNDTKSNTNWGRGINEITLSTDMTLFLGYANTRRIQDTFDDEQLSDKSWACDQAVNYRPANLTDPDEPDAPASSSGWYLPSLGEYNALWQVYGIIRNKFELAGNQMERGNGLYWTSSKAIDGGTLRAASVLFDSWESDKGLRLFFTTKWSAYVRPVLTF